MKNLLFSLWTPSRETVTLEGWNKQIGLNLFSGGTLAELLARAVWALFAGGVVAMIGYFGMARRLRALENRPPVQVNLNIPESLKRAYEATPEQPVPHGKVAEYIPGEKEFCVGTKEGNMTIRLWDGAKTVEDVLYVLQKNGVLGSLNKKE